MDSMKKPDKSSTPKTLMPLLGFIVAGGLGVIAYFLAPELIKFLSTQGIQGMGQFQFYDKLGIVDGDVEGSSARYVFAALIWGLLFSILMVVVAMALGTHPEDEDVIMLRPKENDAKAMKKYYEKLEKQKKKMTKQAKEYQKRKEKEAKKK